jgi:hypothetical protein
MHSLQKTCLILIVLLVQYEGLIAQSFFTDNQVCKAGIATAMGRDPETMITELQASDVIHVSYIRQSDGSLFTYKCRIEGNQILWGNIDGRWRNNSADSVITYSTLDGTLVVSERFPDGSSSNSIYSAIQLEPN